MKSLKHLISKRSLASILAAAVMFTSLPVFSVPVWADDTTIKNEDGSTTTVTTDANGNNVETTTNSEGQVISRKTTYNDDPNKYIPSGTGKTDTYTIDTSKDRGYTQSGTHDIRLSGGGLQTEQDNKKASSDIRAKTEGYRFTNETTGKTIVVSMKDDRISTQTTEYTDSKTGNTMLRIISSFSQALTDQIFSQIGNPLAGGQLVRMDHIMSVTTDGGKSYSGELDAQGNFLVNQNFLDHSPYAARVMKMSADGLFDKNELSALQRVFGWAHPESWETNYEKYLYLKDGVLQKFYFEGLGLIFL